MKKSMLEMLFAEQLAQAGIRGWAREVRFDAVRQWRFDFAWPPQRIAVEIDGGTWKRTRGGRSAGHAHPQRMEDDNEKRNAARLQGWRVFQFTTRQVQYGQAIEVIAQAVNDGHNGTG